VKFREAIPHGFKVSVMLDRHLSQWFWTRLDQVKISPLSEWMDKQRDDTISQHHMLQHHTNINPNSPTIANICK